MRLFRPKSFLGLILVGFILVSVPLLYALGSALVEVEKVYKRGEQTLYRAVRATRIGRNAASEALQMERVARQYQVLEDADLLQNYIKRRTAWHEEILRLLDTGASDEINSTVEQMRNTERDAYLALARKEGSPYEPFVAVTFQRLAKLTESLLDKAQNMIDFEVERLEAKTRRSSKSVVLQALWVIPVTVLLVIYFTFLIAKPIRQLAGEIRRLGDGDLEASVQVKGPADLEYVGEQLDWLRNRLRYVEGEKARFLRSVTHDLKTPLASMREGSELLVGDVLEPPLTEEQKEVAQIMLDASLRLQRLIEDLFEYHKAQERNALRAVSRVAVDDLAKKVLGDHALAARNKHLEVLTEVSAASVFGDSEKIRTVIDNLVSNAIKYTPVGGWIKVKVKQHAGRTVIDVVDSGPGIAAAEHKRIFDVYYRGVGEAREAAEGTGVGLSIVRDYVAIHQGTVESIDSGAGAHLRISLPTRVV